MERKPVWCTRRLEYSSRYRWRSSILGYFLQWTTGRLFEHDDVVSAGCAIHRRRLCPGRSFPSYSSFPSKTQSHSNTHPASPLLVFICLTVAPELANTPWLYMKEELSSFLKMDEIYYIWKCYMNLSVVSASKHTCFERSMKSFEIFLAKKKAPKIYLT